MNDIIFQKQNGGMGRTAASEDPISALSIATNGYIDDNLVNKGFEEINVGSALSVQTLFTETFQSMAALNANGYLSFARQVSDTNFFQYTKPANGVCSMGAVKFQQGDYCDITLPNLTNLVINAITNAEFALQVLYKKGDATSWTTAGTVNIIPQPNTYNITELLPALVSNDQPVTIRLNQNVGGKELYISDLTVQDLEGAADYLYVAKLNYFEQLANQFGISEMKPIDGYTLTNRDKAYNAIVYHVREFFRMSPTGTLYLAIRTNGEATGNGIKMLQKYANGAIRQIGILTPTAENWEQFQTACTGVAGVEEGLEQEHMPLSVLVTTSGNGVAIADLISENLTNPGYCNLSMVVGADLDPDLLVKLGEFAYYGCIGTALGAVSKAMVHESIAWVQKFPLGLKKPGFFNGALLKDVSNVQLELINENRYIFVRTHVGDADNYFNDSHTCDKKTSDYAYIENVRTIDKATRGIRSNLLPNLNAPLYVDPQTGKLRPDNVAYLETVASKALEDMEKAGELSGYRAEIDPNQNVLATSQLEIQIKNVPVGVMRKMLVKIGYTTALN